MWCCEHQIMKDKYGKKGQDDDKCIYTDYIKWMPTKKQPYEELINKDKCKKQIFRYQYSRHIKYTQNQGYIFRKCWQKLWEVLK